MNCWLRFEAVARERPGRPAVETPSETLTFGQLRTRADDRTRDLAREGVVEGGMAVLALPNSPDWIASYLALSRLGAVIALLSPKLGKAEFDAVRERMTPTTVLADPETLRAWSWNAAERQPSGPLPAPTPPAVVKFTSGSTGIPKGIALSHENLSAEAANVAATLGLAAGDRVVTPVSLCHSYGFDLGVLPMIHSGVTLSLPGPFAPRATIADLSQPDVSVFLGVPSMYRFMVDSAGDAPPDLSRVRYLLSCTAPLHPEVIRAFHERFRGTICQHYGSSESGAATNHVPSEVLRRPASVGRALAGVRITIEGEDGVPVPPGSSGEVVVESAAVSGGYVMGADDGAERLGGGRFRTRDLGVLDADGFLEVHGRMDDLINVDGFKVFPLEVAQVLEQHPAVREAAVLGVRDEAGREIVYALVTLRGTATENELLQSCRGRLADYKVPRRIEIRDRLPVGPTGKVRVRPEDIKA